MQIARQSSLHLAQRIMLAGLLLCMAFAQSLSFAHRALHHDVRTLAHAHEERYSGQHAQQLAGAHGHGDDCHHGVFSRLFAHHEEGDETCRLTDGATAFLGLNSPLAGVFAAPNAPVLIAFDTAALAAWRAPLFEARGPPVLSL